MSNKIDLGEARSAIERVPRLSEDKESEIIGALGQMAGLVCHEVNNALAVIFSNIGLVEEAAQSNDPDQIAEIPEMTADMMKGAEKIKALTRGLLAISQHGGINAYETNLVRMLEETVEGFLEKASHCRFEMDFPPAHQLAKFDPTLLGVAIKNLLENAVDAMPQGGAVRLSLQDAFISKDESSLAAPEGNYVKMIIQDEGSGIPEDLRSKMYRPFVTTKDVRAGHGLGLTQVFAAIGRHKGFVRSDSKTGDNSFTRFEIYLPADPQEMVRTNKKPVLTEVDSSTQEPMKEDVSGPQAVQGDVQSQVAAVDASLKLEKLPLSDIEIVIVDDEVMIGKAAQRILKPQGASVKVFNHAPDAADKIGELPPDAVAILDMIMPEMSGLQLAHLIRESRPDVAIALLSGYGISADIQKLITEGKIDGFLQKPITPQNLVAFIKEIVEKRKLAQKE